MHRDAPGPKFQRTVGVGLSRKLCRQVAVFNDLNFSIDLDHVADLLKRFLFADHL